MTSYLPRTMTTTVGRTTLTSTLAGGTLDLLDLPRDQTPAAPPPAFPPFRFEPRRSRIDWRLLHGVDINAIVGDMLTITGCVAHMYVQHASHHIKSRQFLYGATCPAVSGIQVRDVDLDTLEKIVSIVAFGDIEAEDTRHLTELNFIKVFRLSQLMIEYLLYVQDCLQSTNSYLQQDRLGGKTSSNQTQQQHRPGSHIMPPDAGHTTLNAQTHCITAPSHSYMRSSLRPIEYLWLCQPQGAPGKIHRSSPHPLARA